MPKGIRTAELPEVTPSRIGGDVAVDFFNTVDWRSDPSRRHERLPDYRHLLAWLKETGLLSAGEAGALAALAGEDPGRATSEHALVIELRDDTYDALADDGRPGALQRHLPAAHAASRLTREPGGAWNWVPASLDLDTPRHLLAMEFARLLTAEKVARFHRCEDRHCGWVFLDTSRQRNRRWCSAADCGNRNRVRAHYERTRTG
ncbi:CGNR zinc finger domain-containing protein [Phytomonospora endophytica]|uniref:Putative RNA-binding Zn ribbon-like protein n=1 Tax=Phytomonospora endophytica TaxID=714109 RepID=A0A841FYS9_9ACTN|nr:CGNR zinc finger domain-containing protein [Phytomonospora endophytica]MBB6038878.1 putative RNA-binding Zn ribbon-like protein [Phytomonospora endophytica]GIG68327.1 hypothetical protein Pen01_46220 [Phytomonospora endophytica]